MDRVGIRELRQNLSVHLRRVKGGETLEVTEHGRPVAILSPRPEHLDVRERLIAEGKVVPPSAILADLGPPTLKAIQGRSVSEELERDRADRL